MNLIYIVFSFLFLCFSYMDVNAQSITWQKHLTAYTLQDLQVIDSSVITSGIYNDNVCSTLDRPFFSSVRLTDGDTFYTVTLGYDSCYGFGPNALTAHDESFQYTIGSGTIDNRFLSLQRGGIIKFNSSVWDTVGLISGSILQIAIANDSIFYAIYMDTSGTYLQRRNSNNNSTSWSVAITGSNIQLSYDNSAQLISTFHITPASQNLDCVIQQYTTSGNQIRIDTIAYYLGNEVIQHIGSSQLAGEIYYVRSTNTSVRNQIFSLNSSNGTYQNITGVSSTIISDATISVDGQLLYYIGKDNSVSGSQYYVYKINLLTHSVEDSISLSYLMHSASQLAERNGILYISRSVGVNNGRQHVIGRYTSNFSALDSIVCVDTLAISSFVELIPISSNAIIYSTGITTGSSVLYRIDFNPLGIPISDRECGSTSSVLQADFWTGNFGSCSISLLEAYDVSGRLVCQHYTPLFFSFEPSTAGIYIIQVLFENGEVKREKVFLTAN